MGTTLNSKHGVSSSPVTHILTGRGSTRKRAQAEGIKMMSGSAHQMMYHGHTSRHLLNALRAELGLPLER